MFGIRVGLTCAVALLSASASNAQTFDMTAAQSVFDETAAEFPAINVTVMVGGEIVWEAVGGSLRGPEDSVSTDYNFYSIAKMLTGMAYARLVQVEGLDLDQSVRLIDPDLPEAYTTVTLRQLLSHTSGIRHYNSENDWRDFSSRRCETPQAALGHFINDDLADTPGDEQSYTTFGFTLLSHLLVRITGEDTYDAAMTSVLGENYRATTDTDSADQATTYMGDPGNFHVVDGLNAQCKFGGGGLLASSRDLAMMGAALSSGQVFDLDRAPEMFAPFITNSGEEVPYVFGMSAGYSERMSSHYASHSGGSPGGRGYLFVLLENDVVVAFTSNYDGPHFADESLKLARIFSGLPAEHEEG